MYSEYIECERLGYSSFYLTSVDYCSRLAQWKTVAGRSQTYTKKVQEVLGDRAHISTPIVTVKKVAANGQVGYELFTTDDKSIGIFDDLIFACHPPTARKILSEGSVIDDEALDLLQKIEYADNAIYVHSDPDLMPKRRRAWASWNCLGKSELISVIKSSKRGEAFEGGESGFGSTKNDHAELEGEEGRMKAVYVTYWLNRLQNLVTEKEIFVSLNPHKPPQEILTHKRLILAHPQFNPSTLRARQVLEEKFQGRNGIWFCGAWEGYGFHEDGCRSGFKVATKLSEVPLPWANLSVMVLPPPDFSNVKTNPGRILSAIRFVHKSLAYDLPIAICKRFVIYFLDKAIKKGMLQLKFNDGSIVKFGDGSLCGCDASPVTLRVFNPWFFVKTALEYDVGLARSYMAGHYVVEPLEKPVLN